MGVSRTGMLALVASALLGSILLKGVFWAQSQEDPAIAFERVGLTLPATAEIVFDKRDESGPFGTDGRRRIVVHVDEATLNEWQRIAPFHGEALWKPGPISELRGCVLPPKELCESGAMIYAFMGNATDGSVVMLDTANSLAWLCWWY